MLDKSLKILLSFVVLWQIIMLSACNDGVIISQQKVNDQDKQRKESLEKANRYLVLKEKEDIVNYIERHNLNVEWLGTCLCYSIVNQGDTTLVKRGNLVSIEYEVRLLNGDLLYTSREDGLKTFIAGRGGVESGLEEALVHLHTNDVAVVIIPSDAAHGLLGDGNKIPPKTPIVYNLKIIDNQSNKYNN